MSCQDGAAPSQDEHRHGNDVSRGTIGDVLPGSLLGPVMGLAFSADGGLLFACSGSFISVYDVHSGALLSAARVFMPGLAVYGLDVGRESREYRYLSITVYQRVAASDGRGPTLLCIHAVRSAVRYGCAVLYMCRTRGGWHFTASAEHNNVAVPFIIFLSVLTLASVCGVKQTLSFPFTAPVSLGIPNAW